MQCVVLRHLEGEDACLVELKHGAETSSRGGASSTYTEATSNTEDDGTTTQRSATQLASDNTSAENGASGAGGILLHSNSNSNTHTRNTPLSATRSRRLSGDATSSFADEYHRFAEIDNAVLHQSRCLGQELPLVGEIVYCELAEDPDDDTVVIATQVPYRRRRRRQRQIHFQDDIPSPPRIRSPEYSPPPTPPGNPTGGSSAFDDTNTDFEEETISVGGPGTTRFYIPTFTEDPYWAHNRHHHHPNNGLINPERPVPILATRANDGQDQRDDAAPEMVTDDTATANTTARAHSGAHVAFDIDDDDALLHADAPDAEPNQSFSFTLCRVTKIVRSKGFCFLTNAENDIHNPNRPEERIFLPRGGCIGRTLPTTIGASVLCSIESTPKGLRATQVPATRPPTPTPRDVVIEGAQGFKPRTRLEEPDWPTAQIGYPAELVLRALNGEARQAPAIKPNSDMEREEATKKGKVSVAFTEDPTSVSVTLDPPPKATIDAELLCTICQDVQRLAKLVVECGHSYCERCLERYGSEFAAQAAEAGEPNEPTCPCCRAVMGPLVVKDERNRRKIAQLPVCCPRNNADDRPALDGFHFVCFWTGRVDELDSHVVQCRRRWRSEREEFQRNRAMRKVSATPVTAQPKSAFPPTAGSKAAAIHESDDDGGTSSLAQRRSGDAQERTRRKIRRSEKRR